MLKAIKKLVPIFLVASLVYAGWMKACGYEIHLIENIHCGSSSLPIPFTWYVPSILALYSIFYAANRLCHKNVSLIVCVAIGVICYWVVTALVFKWAFYWWKAVGGFVVGMLFAQMEPFVKTAIARNALLVYAIALVGLTTLFGLCHLNWFAVRFVSDHLYYAILGPIAVLIMYRFPLLRFLRPIGLISYEVYIIHGAFVWSIRPCFANDCVYFFVVLTCALFAGFALHKIHQTLDRMLCFRR